MRPPLPAGFLFLLSLLSFSWGSTIGSTPWTTIWWSCARRPPVPLTERPRPGGAASSPSGNLALAVGELVSRTDKDSIASPEPPCLSYLFPPRS